MTHLLYRQPYIHDHAGPMSVTSYLQVQVELAQKEHKGVEFLLSVCVSSNSYIPLFILCLTPTANGNFFLRNAIFFGMKKP